MSADRDLAVLIRADNTGLASDLRSGVDMVRRFARDVEKSSPRNLFGGGRDFGAGAMKAMHAATTQLTGGLRNAAAAFGSFASRAASTAAGMAVYQAGAAGLTGAMDTLRDSVDLAAELEQTTVAFETMLGSAEQATAMVADLRRFAAETPFNSREVFGAAKQLLAYSTAADQVIPQLRVLGEYSAALGKSFNLDRAAFVFGTLQSQGRAYTKDLQQFAGSGVPIYDLLGKTLHKTNGELQKMTEAGDLTIREIGEAMEFGTKKGERFFDGMRRQSQTFAGSLEIAKDAWDTAKAAFGKVVIEEAGLKDSARDFESFAKRVERYVSAEDSPVRKAVRFVADLAKGVVQLGYEFGRAGLRVAEINLEGLSKTFPQLNNFREMVRDLQNFKISPERITAVGLDIFEGITIGVAKTIDWVNTEGKGYYDAFKKNFVDPVLYLIDTLKDAVQWFRNLKLASAAEAKGEEVLREGDRLLTDPARRAAFEAAAPREVVRGAYEQFYHRLATEESRTGPMTDRESRAAFAGRYRELDAGIAMMSQLKAGGTPGADAKLEQLLDYRLKNFLLPFTNEPGKDFRTIHDVFMRGQVPSFNAGLGPVETPKSWEERARGTVGQFRRDVEEGTRRKQAADELSDAQERSARAIRAALAANPFTGMGTPPGLVFPPREVEPERFGRAHEGPQLAGAALVGSQEDARLLAQFMAGNPQTAVTQEYLRRIAVAAEATAQSNKRIETAPEPRPVEVRE